MKDEKCLGTWNQETLWTRHQDCVQGSAEEKRSPLARQVWLKVGGKCRVMELGERRENKLEEKVRGWLGVERWKSMWEKVVVARVGGVGRGKDGGGVGGR